MAISATYVSTRHNVKAMARSLLLQAWLEHPPSLDPLNNTLEDCNDFGLRRPMYGIAQTTLVLILILFGIGVEMLYAFFPVARSPHVPT